MIYIADGPSDVPAWSVVSANGGRAFGVYQRGSLAQFEQISTLQRDGRIDAFAEADYTPDSTAYLWLTTEVRRIAEKIVEEREIVLRRAVRTAPRHLAEPATTPTDAPMDEPDTSPAPPPTPSRSRADEIRDQVRASMEPAAPVKETDTDPVRR
jgi:hypothetical protein